MTTPSRSRGSKSTAAAAAKSTAAPAPDPVADEPVTVAAATDEVPADTPAPAADAAEPSPEPTLVPSATPLEAPAPPAEPEPEPETHINVADALPEDMDGLIVDAYTRQPPTDLETLFQSVTAHGTDRIATARLLEHTTGSRHARPMTRLLVARGAHLSGENASRILATLRAQADVRAAARGE